MAKLSKDDPVYYKVEMNKLIKQAKENGLKVGYEIISRANKITRVQAHFMNDIGEIAGANIYDESWDKEGKLMNEFIKFFNQTASDYPMHLEIYYSKIMDWTIRVWKKMDKDIEIVNIQDCDVELAFAKAQVQLKEWLLENEGGY